MQPNELLCSGRFELSHMLLRAFDETPRAQTATMTWVDSAAYDLSTLGHLDGVRAYYRDSPQQHKRAGDNVAHLEAALRYVLGIGAGNS